MTPRSTSARTAFGPMVIAAAEQYTPAAQRLFRDELAVRFLPLGPRLAARACRWRFVRTLLMRATEDLAPGMWGGVICRKRYADDKVVEAVGAGIGQVVILGAGLDTRAYRLVAPAGGRAYELDQPANTAVKAERLQAVLGSRADQVRVIPVDFQTDDVGTALAENGFDIGEPALFVWEAVTQYLTEDAVRTTLAFLSRAARQSRLIFTYVRKDFLDGTNLYGAARLHRRMTGKYDVWHFGLAPHEVGALLLDYGWAEREQVGSAEYTARYLEPVGRDLEVSELERFVHAERV
ncbi:SAM-dependent methyltransferase [Pseudonocardia xinjiangensis]|uniref:SAM-dependent methyltransferase n=1 Tax=Pseudonocardia xinjiangensis TaxID=75289 RepID=UPI003D934EC8